MRKPKLSAGKSAQALGISFGKGEPIEIIVGDFSPASDEQFDARLNRSPKMEWVRTENAFDCAPKKCQCGARLGKPISDFPWKNPRGDWHAPHAPIQEKVWHIACKCGLVYVWSWHETPKPYDYTAKVRESSGCWKIRSILPIFDSEEIVSVQKSYWKEAK